MREALLAGLLALAPAAKAGEGAAFLRIEPGARPIAMGEAYTAVSDDLGALAANPSGLSRIGSREAGFMHAELFAGTHYDFLGYAQPLSQGAPLFLGGGTLGFGVQRLSNDPIPGRDASGQPTGSFTAADTAFDLAFSRRLPDAQTLVGVNAKLIESQVADASARTAAFDLGLMQPVRLGGRAFMLGAAVENVGPGLRYGSQTTSLPLAFAVGASMRVSGVLLLAADVKDRPNSGETSFDLGTEYALMPAFSLRLGYGATAGPAAAGPASAGIDGGLGGLGMGFGLKIYKATLDYSFTPAGELGNAQRLSLSSRF